MRLGWILQYLAKTEGIINNRFLYQKIFLPLVRGQAKRMERLPPSTVLIEGTNKCNAQCITCPHKYMKRSVGVMDFSLYKKIVDECQKLKVYSVHPYGFGEPLLDPLLVERIRYTKDKGIPYVPIFSNWSIIEKQIMIDLIYSGLDEVIVSYYGTDRETFEKVRVNIDFERVNYNIEEFIRIRNSMKRKQPSLKLFIVKHLEEEPDMRKVYKKWRDKVDDILAWPAANWADATDRILLRRPKIIFPCIALWDSINIHWNGDVVLCSRDYDGLCKLGNIKDVNITEIRNIELLEDIRKRQLSGKFNEIEICRNCSQITFSWPRWFMRALSQLAGRHLCFLKR